MVYQERIKGSVIPADYVEYVRPPQASDEPPVPPEPEWWIEEPIYTLATRVTFAAGEQAGEQYKGFLTKKGLQYAWGTNGVAETEWVTADGTPCDLKKPSDDCELMVR